MNRYLKFGAEVFFTAVAAVVAAMTDNLVDTSEWINVLILTLGAVAVLGAGNLPAGVWAYTKTIVSAATAAAVALQSAITDGVSTAEWLQIALAAAATLGVYQLKGPRVSGRHAAADGV